MKKAILSALILIPTLVACGGRDIVETQGFGGQTALVDCNSGEIKWEEAEDARLDKFMTPEEGSKVMLEVAKEQDNPFAELGSHIYLGGSRDAVSRACEQ